MWPGFGARNLRCNTKTITRKASATAVSVDVGSKIKIYIYSKISIYEKIEHK